MACCCGAKNCDCTCCLRVNGKNLCTDSATRVCAPEGNPNFGTCYTIEDWGLGDNFYHKIVPARGSGYFDHGVGSQYRLDFVLPTCTPEAGWTIASDWTLTMKQDYSTNWPFGFTATKTYKVRPTLEIDENGCPQIAVGDFEFVSSVNVDNWDVVIFRLGDFVFTKQPFIPVPAAVLEALEAPAGLASSISLQCTPGNPLP